MKQTRGNLLLFEKTFKDLLGFDQSYRNAGKEGKREKIAPEAIVAQTTWPDNYLFVVVVLS